MVAGAGTNTVKQLDPDLVPVDQIVQFTVPYEAVGAPTAILAFPAPGEACNETSLHAYPVNSTHFEVSRRHAGWANQCGDDGR